MAQRRGWPIAVVPVSDVCTGGVVFRAGGKLHGLVVVKAAFRLRAGQLAELGPTPALVRSDEHHDRSPLRSLRAPSDLSLFRDKCDVWLRGHCHAPLGRSVQVAATRLALYREREPLIDKALHIYGDRATADTPPAAFQRLPIEYERAFGGVGVVDNPVGVGSKPGDRQPNIVDPSDPQRPAGYGPIARYWRARKHGLSDEVRAGLDRRIVELPDDFDWTYFQSVPADQQSRPLRGDEWLLLEGMHPAVARLQCGLPAVRAEARLWSRAATHTHPGLPIPLIADDLGIDADEQLFTICWRGSFPLPSLDMLASVCVGAGLSVRGQPIDWAPFWERAGSVTADLEGIVDAPRETPGAELAQTAFLSPEEVATRMASATSLPFGKAGQNAAMPAPDHAAEEQRAVPVMPWEQARAAGSMPPAAVSAPPPPPAARPAVSTPPPAVSTPPPAVSTPPPAVSTPSPSAPVQLPGTPIPAQVPQATPSSPWAAAPPGAGRSEPPPRVGALPLPPPPAVAVPPPAVVPVPPARVSTSGATGTAVPFAVPPKATAPGTIPPLAPAAGAALPPAFMRSTAQRPTTADPRAPSAQGLPFLEAAGRRVRSAHPSALGPEDAHPSEPPDAVELERGNSVPALTDSSLHVVTLAWSLKPPTPSLTAIVKGTFDLVADGPATLRDECDFPTGDTHADDDLSRSITYASDFAVFKPKADVTVVGTAHAPRGRSMAMEVGFRLGAGSGALTRRIAVLGDRQWVGVPASMSEPAAFEAMPLTWERAYGGHGHERNPVGVGHGARKDASGVARLPNLEQHGALIKSPGDRPSAACFAPVPELWRPRWSNLGTYDASWRLRRWPYFPEDFDYAYFQAAPNEQQVDYLRGDEAYEIWGLLPGAAKISGSLPGTRVRCFAAHARRAGGELREVQLQLDTCAFDVDAMKVNLVWRGLLEVSADDAPELEALFVTTEPLAQPPASLAQVAHQLGMAKWRAAFPEDAIDEDAGAANDGDVDPELALELIRAEQARAEALLRATPFGASAPEVRPMPLPAAPTPEQVGEQLRAAGASEPDIAAALAALSAPLPPDPRGRPVGAALRALVERRVSEGRALGELDLTGADLTGANLAGADLQQAQLVDANLRSADLRGANFAGAQLAGCDLQGAMLDEASLDAADLTGANLDDATLRGAYLRDAVLEEVSAERADFSQARGSDASFAGARLALARFTDAELEGADFSGATLDEASFEGAKVPEIRLYDAHGERVSFRGANLAGARADGAKLPRVVMENAVAPDSVWEQADLSFAVLTRANLSGASLVKANCEAAQLSGCELKEARLKEAVLVRAQLVMANLFQASLEGADLTRADLRGANLHRAEVWKATLTGALLDDAILTGTKLET